NARKCRHRRLDHLRADLVAADAQDVLVAPGDREKSLGIESREVARLDPNNAEHAPAVGRLPEIVIDRDLATDAQQALAAGRLHHAMVVDDLRPHAWYDIANCAWRAVKLVCRRARRR